MYDIFTPYNNQTTDVYRWYADPRTFSQVHSTGRLAFAPHAGAASLPSEGVAFTFHEHPDQVVKGRNHGTKITVALPVTATSMSNTVGLPFDFSFKIAPGIQEIALTYDLVLRIEQDNDAGGSIIQIEDLISNFNLSDGGKVLYHLVTTVRSTGGGNLPTRDYPMSGISFESSIGAGNSRVGTIIEQRLNTAFNLTGFNDAQAGSTVYEIDAAAGWLLNNGSFWRNDFAFQPHMLRVAPHTATFPTPGHTHYLSGNDVVYTGSAEDGPVGFSLSNLYRPHNSPIINFRALLAFQYRASYHLPGKFLQVVEIKNVQCFAKTNIDTSGDVYADINGREDGQNGLIHGLDTLYKHVLRLQNYENAHSRYISRPSGRDGTDGQDGHDGVDGQNGSPGLNGFPGQQGLPGPPGQDGRDGVDGQDGAPGERGARFWATVNSATISSITSSTVQTNYPGVAIGDYFVNTRTTSASVTILGTTAAIGAVVRIDSDTTGTLVGNIRGAEGAPGAAGAKGDTGAAGRHIYVVNANTNTTANVSTNAAGARVGDYLVAGTAVQIAGSSRTVGQVFEIATLPASGNITVTARGDIRGATGAAGAPGTNGTNGTNGAPGATGARGARFWATVNSTSISNTTSSTVQTSYAGVAIGDYFVNTRSGSVSILGLTAAVGDMIRIDSNTAGTLVGNVRGATGATGATGPAGAPGQDAASTFVATTLWGSADWDALLANMPVGSILNAALQAHNTGWLTMPQGGALPLTSGIPMIFRIWRMGANTSDFYAEAATIDFGRRYICVGSVYAKSNWVDVSSSLNVRLYAPISVLGSNVSATAMPVSAPQTPGSKIKAEPATIKAPLPTLGAKVSNPSPRRTVVTLQDSDVPGSGGGGGGSGENGAIVVPDSYFFQTDAARDAYFAANPSELIDGRTYVVVDGTLQRFQNGAWVDLTAVIRGPTGQPGRDGNPGKDGLNGRDGQEGSPGSPGIPGEPGPPGKDGQDGADGLPGRDGVDGVDGRDGTNGQNGVGVPAGGLTGQVLKKASNADFDTTWANDNVGDGVGGGGVESVTALQGETLVAVNNSDATNPVVSSTQTLKNAVTLAGTALRSFTETDPVFTAAQPTLALKS